MQAAPVVVVGSVNYDLIVSQDRLPHRGETFVATRMRGAHGGKGANQAVQAARLGAAVHFVGGVGDDEFGRLARANLVKERVESHLHVVDEPSGLGIVHVVGEGDVYATIVEGANGRVDGSWVERHAALIAGAGVVILQNEVPESANARSIELASAAGVPIVYNAAPARPLPRRLSRACTWFVVNEDEAAAYLRRPLGDPLEDAAMREAVAELQDFCRNVVLTLGGTGSYVAVGEEVRFVAPHRVVAVDTTGAGDSFIGAFAAELVQGASPFDAARVASMVASITVGGVGAQSSMPTRGGLEREVLRQAQPDS